ncbi:hypothetical protein BDZ89DRAFT_1066871, partial [Hymenopellis radicata]
MGGGHTMLRVGHTMHRIRALTCIAAAETCIPPPSRHASSSMHHASQPRTSLIVGAASMPLESPHHPSRCPHSMHRILLHHPPFVLTFRRVQSDSHYCLGTSHYYRLSAPSLPCAPRVFLSLVAVSLAL